MFCTSSFFLLCSTWFGCAKVITRCVYNMRIEMYTHFRCYCGGWWKLFIHLLLLLLLLLFQLGWIEGWMFYRVHEKAYRVCFHWKGGKYGTIYIAFLFSLCRKHDVCECETCMCVEVSVWHTVCSLFVCLYLKLDGHAHQWVWIA